MPLRHAAITLILKKSTKELAPFAAKSGERLRQCLNKLNVLKETACCFSMTDAAEQ